MPMRTYRSNSPKMFISAGDSKSMADYERECQENVSGHDPLGRGDPAPGPTRATSHPWTETNQRKPYLPVEDISEPTLDDGVSYRQRIY